MVKLLYEHIDVQESLSWRHALSDSPGFEFNWHYHHSFELTLITAGTGQRFIGDSFGAYEPGDLALIGPELPHSYVSDADSHDNRNVVVQFTRDFLGAGFFDRPEFAGIAAMLDQASSGLVFPTEAAAEVSDVLCGFNRQGATERTLALLGVLARLAEAAPERLASQTYRPDVDRAMHGTVDTVCRYLGQSYTRQVTLSEVARVAHLSPAAFCRFFRRAMGRTMTAYLIELRVAAACKMLIDTDLAITEIAVRSGFQNRSNFNRRFREVRGITPREHRAAFLQSTGAVR